MDDLLPSVEAFLLVHGMKASTFGRQSLNDSSLVDDIRKGRELSRSTEAAVRKFMENADRQRSEAARGPAESGMFSDEGGIA